MARRRNLLPSAREQNQFGTRYHHLRECGGKANAAFSWLRKFIARPRKLKPSIGNHVSHCDFSVAGVCGRSHAGMAVSSVVRKAAYRVRFCVSWPWRVWYWRAEEVGVNGSMSTNIEIYEMSSPRSRAR